MKNMILVMIGGGIGAVLRYIVSTLLQNKFNLKHWATFCVNITGCFLIGLLFGYLITSNQALYTLIIVGIIGSYTTFSAFEYENIDLIAHEKYAEFLIYSISSCTCGFLSVIAGTYFSKLL